jgi:hypothetical protein
MSEKVPKTGEKKNWEMGVSAMRMPSMAPRYSGEEFAGTIKMLGSNNRTANIG